MLQRQQPWVQRDKVLLWLCVLCLSIGSLVLGTRSAPLAVNAGSDPSQVGQWSAPSSWPSVAVNSILLPTGKVLTYQSGTMVSLWDPTTGISASVPLGTSDLFCSGHSLLPDGRVAVIGGYNPTAGLGIPDVNIFDPSSQSWTVAAPMKYARWYPSSTTLPDGRLLATGGASTCTTCYDPIPEVFDPTTNTWTSLTGASSTVPSYPFMFVLPDGRILKTGASEVTTDAATLNVQAQQWTVVDSNVVDGGSAVMYRPGQIMKAGTAADSGGTSMAAATTYVLDMTQPSPRWRQTAPMAYPRAFLNLTSLPDGNVLATGGGTDTTGTYLANAVLPAEIWSPSTATWTTMAAMQTPRLYHSTALLLPDARVLVAGGGADPWDAATDEKNAEIYSPPYLFKGSRPTITSAPDTIQYGNSFSVSSPDAASVASISLIALGAVTHAFNQNQRFLNLPFQAVGNTLTITAPATANMAPPGYYMLFLVNGNGVPSVASFVRLPVPATDSVAPTAPSNLSAAVSGGSVTLNWGASTDNVGVTGYNVYRSTTPNFVPNLTTEISTTGATSFTDASIPTAGNYYYAVAAVDAAGNISSPSNQVSTITGIQLVQNGANGNESATGNMTLVLPADVKAGSFLIVSASAARPASHLTIADSAGDTFLPAYGPVNDPAQDVNLYVWYVQAARGGPTTFTITPPAPAALEMHVSEWSGMPANAMVDQTSSGIGNSSVVSSGSQTTTASGDLVYGYAWVYNTASAGSGFTGLSLINGDLDEYRVQPSAGTVAATFNQSSPGTWLAIMTTFRGGPAATNSPTATPVATNTPAQTATALSTGTAVAATSTPPATATGTTGGGTLGVTTVGSQTDTSDAGSLNGTRIQTGAGGAQVSSLSVHVGAVGAAPNNQYQVAIYRDSGGAPGTLVAHSAPGTLAANAWNTLPLAATLAPNTAYWLVYNAAGSSAALNDMQYSTGGSAVSGYSNASVAFGTWPASFGAATEDTGWAFSLYATYSG